MEGDEQLKTRNRRIGEKGFVGICFPSRNQRLNARRLFMPASNTKLYTSWLACRVLGEDAIFDSTYSIDGTTLYVYPNWNPLLSSGSMERMLEEVEGRKIDRVVVEAEGRALPRYPTTWSFSDRNHAWGAPVCSTCFDENYISLKGGAKPVMTPANGYYRVNYTKSGGVPSVSGHNVSLPENFRGLFEFPVLDPDGFLAHWIAERLGVSRAAVRNAGVTGKKIRFGQASMKNVLKVVNKRSCNIMAELLAVHSSRKLGLPMGYDTGIRAFRELLPEAGIRDAVLFDGSGVSRYNLVSPEGTVRLLEACRDYPSIRESLPIGGKDGTLKGRKLPARVRAKTGSIYGVQTLSGYDGDDTFSVMLNHYPGGTEEMTDAIDSIVRGSY